MCSTSRGCWLTVYKCPTVEQPLRPDVGRVHSPPAPTFHHAFLPATQMHSSRTKKWKKSSAPCFFDNPAPHLCGSSISSPELWFVGTGRDCLWRVGGGATSTSDSHLLPASLPQLAAACKHSQRRHHTFPPPLTTPTSQNMAKCAAL